MDAERFAQKQARRHCRRMRHGRRTPIDSAVLGALIVAIGSILLLNNLGIFVLGDLWRYWPVILIAAGVAKIAECARPSAMVGGALFAGTGTFLLLRNLDILVLDIHVVWPVLLIGLGVAMLIKALEEPFRLANSERPHRE